MEQIKSREDITLLVSTFYTTAMKDELIGHFFTDMAKIDLESHLPVMYDFWESILFHKAIYKGNPMTKHMVLDQKSPMEPIHFDRCLSLWKQTVNQLFDGEIAEEAKTRAEMIKSLMQHKVLENRKFH